MSLWKSPWASEQGRTGPWLGSPWRSQRGRPIWTPSELFKNGEQGAWYDPSDLSTLYQDAAGTTPVTADGDPVGLMLDKSGNGNHATQSVSASRPVYRTDGVLHWLSFDGVDDALVTSLNAAQGNADRGIFIAADSPEDPAEIAYKHWVHSGTASNGRAFGLVYRVSGEQAPRDGFYLGNHYWGSGYSSDFSSIGKDVFSVVKNGDEEVYSRFSAAQEETNIHASDTGSGVYRIFQITAGNTNEIGKGGLYGLLIAHSGLDQNTSKNCQRYLATKAGVQL